MITNQQFTEAYDKAKAFFQANPNKWGRNRMFDRNTSCYCMAGRMAVELGTDPLDADALSNMGWAVNDKLHEVSNPDITGINDTANSLAQVIERLDPLVNEFRK